jgi:hypothetical protein
LMLQIWNLSKVWSTNLWNMLPHLSRLPSRLITCGPAKAAPLIQLTRFLYYGQIL